MPALSPSYMRRQPLLGGIIHGIADNVKAFNSHLADLAHPDPTPTTSPPPVTSALDNGNRHGQGDDDHDDDGGDHDGDEDDHDGDGNHHDGDGKDDGKHGKNGNKNGGGGDNNNGGGDDGNSGGATLSSPPPNEPPQGGSPTPTGPSAPPPDATKGGAATSGTSPSESPPDGTETTSNSNAGHQPGLPVDNSNKKTTSPSSSSTPETSQPSSGGGSSKAEFGSSTETTSSAVITFLPTRTPKPVHNLIQAQLLAGSLADLFFSACSSWESCSFSAAERTTPRPPPSSSPCTRPRHLSRAPPLSAAAFLNLRLR
ncbi:hypothetical protein C8R43DRAFT_140993 [Mycena crocata]|nr:hypothetical protein C8R43DRAFT_140993 [Mycena crocata]